ncbi:hypothetical protein HPA02_08360 [Bisbaumannia pacifica]|uniref:Uncharacterized protein n=1 Tax=Bisbaumannia pacifica TaxID=77098 RepID=A0A510X553_9GAMM|nr:hypothetical protein [Halomonas pacifica]GEK46553.1 hypothetical protein HPA02_08360 [Halomonas pacifica]
MTLDELMADVALEVPDAPRASIRDMIRWAARELCTEADAWVTEEGPVIYGADSDYPAIVAPAGEPLRIVSLTLGGREVGQGDQFEQRSPTDIHFYRQPGESVVNGRLACRPRPGEMPPDAVTSRWASAIGDGARWRLLLLPQPWRNPELASYYQQRFLAGIADARQHSRLGHARGGARVMMRRFI